MLLLRTHRSGHGNGARDAADRAAGTQHRSQPAVHTEQPRALINRAEGDQGDDACLKDGDRSRPCDQRQGQAGTEQHDPGLDVELYAQARLEPMGQADAVGEQ